MVKLSQRAGTIAIHGVALALAGLIIFDILQSIMHLQEASSLPADTSTVFRTLYIDLSASVLLGSFLNLLLIYWLHLVALKSWTAEKHRVVEPQAAPRTFSHPRRCGVGER